MEKEFQVPDLIKECNYSVARGSCTVVMSIMLQCPSLGCTRSDQGCEGVKETIISEFVLGLDFPHTMIVQHFLLKQRYTREVRGRRQIVLYLLYISH